jgi:hypothetical protein
MGTGSRSPKVSLTAFSAQPPDLPTGALDGYGLRSTVQTRPTPYASIRFLSIGSRLCFHASFRCLLAESPLRFAITSPPSGCERDFHPPAVRHAWHTRSGVSRPPQLLAAGRLRPMLDDAVKASIHPFCFLCRRRSISSSIPNGGRRRWITAWQFGLTGRRSFSGSTMYCCPICERGRR